MNLIVKGLPRDVFEPELQEIFEQFGRVANVKVIMDSITLKSRGFGFVEMPDTSEALNAIKELDGSTMEDKTMSVKEVENKRPPQSNFSGRPRRDDGRGGGYGNRGGGGFNRGGGGYNRGGGSGGYGGGRSEGGGGYGGGRSSEGGGGGYNRGGGSGGYGGGRSSEGGGYNRDKGDGGGGGYSRGEGDRNRY